MANFKEKSLSRSLLKGTILNLGLQLANRNLSKNNFWQTLLVGAAGGFGDYFGGNTAMGAIIGGGNALINKTKDFGTAVKYAAIGGAADLLLKVKEAKAEELPGKDVWTILEDYHLPKGDLRPHSQRGNEAGCAQATLDSIAEYLGKAIKTAKYYEGYDFTMLAKLNDIYADDLDKMLVGKRKINVPNIVGSYLNRGFPAALTYNNDGIQHIVGINRIQKERKEIIDKKGVVSEKFRWRVQIMNPLNEGSLEFISISLFEAGLVSIVRP